MTQLSQNKPYIVLKSSVEYLTRSFAYEFSDSINALDDCVDLANKTKAIGTIDNVYYLCDEAIKKGKRFTGAMVGVYAYAGEKPVEIRFGSFDYAAYFS